jgi:hypothetical protein
MPKLEATAVAAAARCSNGEGKTTCQLDWVEYFELMNSQVGAELSTLAVIQAVLAKSERSLVTLRTGGTSKADGYGTRTSAGATAAVLLSMFVILSLVCGAPWLLTGRSEVGG